MALYTSTFIDQFFVEVGRTVRKIDSNFETLGSKVEFQ